MIYCFTVFSDNVPLIAGKCWSGDHYSDYERQGKCVLILTSPVFSSELASLANRLVLTAVACVL